MKVPHRLARFCGFTCVELVAATSICLPLAALSSHSIMQHLYEQKCQVASDNLGMLHGMLKQFQLDYSCYPCDATAEELEKNAGLPKVGPMKGESANSYYRQLLAVGEPCAEGIFHAELTRERKVITHRADGIIADGKALERGENAMAYVMRQGRDGEKHAVNKPAAPLAICGVAPSSTPYSGTGVSFDTVSFGSKVFVLYADGIVNSRSAASGTSGLFPKTKRGRDTAGDYVVLNPEL